jgi:hypothetical protein
MASRKGVPYHALYPRATQVGVVTVVEEVSGDVVSVERSQVTALQRYSKKCKKLRQLPSWVAPDGYGFRFHEGRPKVIRLSDGTIKTVLGRLTGRVFVDRGGPISRMFKRRRE